MEVMTMMMKNGPKMLAALALLLATTAHAQERGLVLGEEKPRAAGAAGESTDIHVIELRFRDGQTDVRVRIRNGEIESVEGRGVRVQSTDGGGRTMVWESSRGAASLVLKETRIPADAKPKSRLGVLVDEVPEALAVQLRIDQDASLMINSVEEGGAAEEAGLEKYDVVVALDGRAGATRARLREILCAKGPGETMVLTLLRKGDEHELEVTLEAPRAEPASTWTPSFLNWWPMALPQAGERNWTRQGFPSPYPADPRHQAMVQELLRQDRSPSRQPGSAPDKRQAEPDLAERLQRIEKQMARLEKLLQEATDR